jgi:tRNA dimethylallyltransferase
VVCGPSASGKSDLSDALAERLTQTYGLYAPTLVVDSMQVYEELPVITNQARRRRAELVGIVSVSEEWTVGRHRCLAEGIIGEAETPFVLDAGTGMYLNAVVLDVPLAPKVSQEIRTKAAEISGGAQNPRRAARAKELELAGAPARGSIWDGDLRYATTTVVYLRPATDTLDAAVVRRSQKIARGGLEEAAKIKELVEGGAPVNPPVLDSIGVRELIEHLSERLTLEEATSQIATRTRQLTRRQRRWFDKLAHSLSGRAQITVAESPAQIDVNSIVCMIQ